MRPCSTEPSHCRSTSRAARQAPALPGCLPAAAEHGQQAPRGTAPGQPRWPPASCLGVVWTAHQRDREEGATVRLTSREKQSTEGVGQGRRGFSLKERKREGEAVTLKDREGELVAQGWLGWLAGTEGKGAGRGRLPSASMEERRAAAHRAATAEHSAVFISALLDHNNMNESAVMGGRRKEK